MPIYLHLAEYLDSFKSAPPKAIAVPTIDKEHALTLNTCICELTPTEKFSHDRTVLFGRLLPGLCSVVMTSWRLPVEDELTKGARQMMQQRVIPIWLVLAFQVYLDIHYVLTSSMGKIYSLVNMNCPRCCQAFNIEKPAAYNGRCPFTDSEI